MSEHPAKQPAEADPHALRSLEREQACDFQGAAHHAYLAQDYPRALRLAALAGDREMAVQSTALLARTASREQMLGVAHELAVRGFGREAGDLFAQGMAYAEAAEAYAAAGEACAAAQCFERAGRPADGARVLDAALRLLPTDAAARLALGRLLAHHGRTEAAIKALQLLAPGTVERAQALPLLLRGVRALGLQEAAAMLQDEMDRLGVSEKIPDRAPAQVCEAARLARSVLLGRYEVMREVTATPHARVLEANDRVTGEHVAIKLFVPPRGVEGRDALVRFEREARALGGLHHPHIVPFCAYHPEGPVLVLAWMSGGTLAERLRSEPMAPARAAEIACAVLSALGEAHRLGILHRDIKPSNVLFDEAGAARLSDFGVAHLGDLSVTVTAGPIGTFAYMSPEQRRGLPASIASDVYGAGVLLCELLTGDVPGAVKDPRTPLPSQHHPDLHEEHDAVVAQLLHEDPNQRPRDAFDARSLLQSVRWSERMSPHPPRPRLAPSEPRTPQQARLTAAQSKAEDRDAARKQHDTWLDRDVLVLPADDVTLAQARAFARAGHTALPAVLRVDREAGTVWVAAPRGHALADEPHPLTTDQAARLSEALAALHAVGGVHGAVDAEHLYWHEGELTLAFPRRYVGEEALEQDRQALARLLG